MAFARPCAAANPALPLLPTVQQVHSLSRTEAALGYPVRLDRAQVLYFQPSTGIVFLKDSSTRDAIEAIAMPPAILRPGDIVSLNGVTGAAGAAVFINHARIRTLGRAPLPRAPAADFHSLFSGDYDGRWVTVEGIITSALSADKPDSASAKTSSASSPSELKITLTSGWDQVEISTVDFGAAGASGLIDAKVRVRAIVSNWLNHRDLLIGIRLFVPDLSSLEILESPAPDPFALPLTGIGALTSAGVRESGHRLHARGVITSAWNKQNFSIKDSEHGVFVTSDEPIHAGVGDLVDVAGFPSMGDYTPILDHALLRRIGTAALPPPVRVTAAQALSGTHDAEPIELDGRLLDRSRNGDGSYTLLLADERVTFQAAFLQSVPTRFAERLRLGSLLRLRGVCVVEAGGDHVPRDFQILIHSPDDVRTLESPPWWSPLRVLLLAGFLLVAVIAVIAWNALLRRHVRTQTSLIRSQLETASTLRLQAEAAHQEKSQALTSLQSAQQDLLAAQEELRYQATHDALTGLWNHVAIMDALRNETERAMRTGSPLGILLLDADHFKSVNDTYGHLVGDAVLKEIGQRLAGAMRTYDVAGRYGGEEFLILLPACGDSATRDIADRIRSAIATVPFSAGEIDFFLTVSIGATVCFGRSSYDSLFLKEADQALYLAKSLGRNRVILHSQPQLDSEDASCTSPVSP